MPTSTGSSGGAAAVVTGRVASVCEAFVDGATSLDGVSAVVALGAFYRNVQTFDAAQGGRETQFSLPAALSPQAPTP